MFGQRFIISALAKRTGIAFLPI